MTKQELEKKVAELLDQNKFLNEEINALRQQLALAEQGGGHTRAYDELMDRARKIADESMEKDRIIEGYLRTFNIIKAAVS